MVLVLKKIAELLLLLCYHLFNFAASNLDQQQRKYDKNCIKKRFGDERMSCAYYTKNWSIDQVMGDKELKWRTFFNSYNKREFFLRTFDYIFSSNWYQNGCNFLQWSSIFENQIYKIYFKLASFYWEWSEITEFFKNPSFIGKIGASWFFWPVFLNKNSGIQIYPNLLNFFLFRCSNNKPFEVLSTILKLFQQRY